MTETLASIPPILTPLAAALGLWLAITNGLAFVAFGIDKRRASDGGPRIPETLFLLLATIGGWIGAKVAQRFFQHKAYKQPFGMLLNLSGLLLPAVLGLPFLIDAAPDVVTKAVAAMSTVPSAKTPDPTETASAATTPLTSATATGTKTTVPPVPDLPRRIGPGSTADGSGAKATQKTLKIPASN